MGYDVPGEGKEKPWAQPAPPTAAISPPTAAISVESRDAALGSIDLVLQILSAVDSDGNCKATALQMMTVCKWWRDLARQLPLWNHMNFSECNRHASLHPDTPRALLASLQAWWGRQLRSFDAGGCPLAAELLTDAVLVRVAECAPRLEALRLEACCRITDCGLWGVARCGAPFLSLVHLQLHHCGQGVTASGLLKVAEVCPQLQTLSVSCSVRGSGNGLATVGDAVVAQLLALCPRITRLGLSDTGVGDAGLAAIAAALGPRLLHLDLSYCPRFGPWGLQALVAGGCTGLRTFAAVASPGVDDAGVVALARGCPGLAALNLRRCTNVTYGGVWRAIASNPSIEAIDLYRGWRPSDLHAAAAAEQHNNGGGGQHLGHHHHHGQHLDQHDHHHHHHHHHHNNNNGGGGGVGVVVAGGVGDGNSEAERRALLRRLADLSSPAARQLLGSYPGVVPGGRVVAVRTSDPWRGHAPEGEAWAAAAGPAGAGAAWPA